MVSYDVASTIHQSLDGWCAPRRQMYCKPSLMDI